MIEKCSLLEKPPEGFLVATGPEGPPVHSRPMPPSSAPAGD